MNKALLKKALATKTMCTIQYNGWTCGTCFFAIDSKLRNRDWQTLLLFRGDSEESELNNLPPKEKREDVLKKILKLCGVEELASAKNTRKKI